MAKSLISYPITSFTIDSGSVSSEFNKIRFGKSQNKHYIEFDNGSQSWAYSTPIVVPHHYVGGNVSVMLAGYFAASVATGDLITLDVGIEVYKQGAASVDFYNSTTTHSFGDLAAITSSTTLSPGSISQTGMGAIVPFTYPEADNIEVADLLTIRFRRNGAHPTDDTSSDSFRILCVNFREDT